MSLGIWIVLAIAAVGLIWLIGSIALRFAGWLTMVASLVVFAGAFRGGAAALVSGFLAIAAFIIGVVLWLAGHWLAAFKSTYFSSTVAERILTRLGGRLDPTRNWAVPVQDIHRR
ncbi:hypothetical protein ACH4PU_31090 [Streptomyces sp. NPDC021100]|uniref:hypothetical protein n=1 Tax=Streptomyces sp. NPDC021100 TaxID=3365114 RepID=UPI00378D1D6C